jgi:sodium/hydrogen antiporter
MISWTTLETAGWLGVLLALSVFFVCRPLAVYLALLGTRTDRKSVLFMGWFGPRGIATMAFSLLVLESQSIAQGQLIFSVCAVVVLCSVLLHGLTDTVGAEYMACETVDDADEEYLVPGEDPTLPEASVSA